MFKVLLYVWLLITIVLVGVVCIYIVHRFVDIYKKRRWIDDTFVVPNDTPNWPINFHEELLMQDTETGEIIEIVEDTIMQPIEEDADDEIIVEEEIVEIVVVEEEEEGEEWSDEDVQENSETETIVEIPTPVVATPSPVAHPTTQYNFGTESPVMIETPKDLDASRNIAQGHSRDDIVRDKFEKHIQKIRYEWGILKQRNDMLGYEKKLVEGITLLPSDKDFQKQLADLYFHQGKYKKAQSLLKKILTDTPDDHNALWQVGEIAIEEWHIEDAYVYFKQAYTLCDDNPKYCFSLAQWYYDNDDLDNALPLMEKMVKLRPKNIDYLVSLSHVQHKIGMNEEAKQSLLRALELDPMNITLKNYLKWF